MTSAVGRRPVTPARSPIRLEAIQADGIRRTSELAAIPFVIGIVGGMALGIGPLASASAIGAILLAVAMPHAGLAVLAFMAALVPPAVIPAPGFDVALVVATLLGCVYRLPIDRPHLRLGGSLLLVIAFTVYVTVQQAPEMLSGYRTDADHDVGYLYLQLLAAVGTLIAAAYLLRDRSPYPILGMALAGATVVSVIAILSNGATNVAPPLGNLVAQSNDLGRATGPFRNPNYLGTYVGLMLVTAAGLFLVARSAQIRSLLVIVMAILGVALALSLSRGAVLATLVGVAVLLLFRGRAVALAFLGGGVIAAVLAYPLFVQWRLQTLLGSASPYAYLVMNESDGGRLTGLTTAPALFFTSPISGIGFGHFVPDSVMVSGTSTPINAHNWYLTVLAEQGLVGIALVTLIAIVTVVRIAAAPAGPRALAFGLLAALATSGVFLEPTTSFQLLAVPVIVLVAAVIADWRIGLPGSRGSDGSAVASIPATEIA